MTRDFTDRTGSDSLSGSQKVPVADADKQRGKLWPLSDFAEFLATLVSSRLLPEFPAAGSRDNKIPKFAGNTLNWEQDAGGGDPREAGTGLSLSGNTLNIQVPYSSSEKSKLSGIQSGAERNSNRVSSNEKSSGTSTNERSFTPRDVHDMIDIHAPSTGEQGPQGDPGPQGEQGDPGPQGEQGDPGPQGDRGPQGIQGETGPQGEQGDPGPTGAAGQDGADGRDGVDGQDGADGADGATGPAGPAGPTFSGYIYNEHEDLTFAAVSGQAISADGTHEVSLINQSFPGGFEANNDFVTEYEGFITFRTSESDNYTFTLSVVHTFGDGTSIVSRRTFTDRVTRNQIYTLQLNAFNSRSQVRLGSYTDQDGNTITVTQEMIDAASTIEIKFAAQNNNENESWTLQELSITKGAVTFWQISHLEGTPSTVGPVGPQGPAGADAEPPVGARHLFTSGSWRDFVTDLNSNDAILISVSTGKSVLARFGDISNAGHSLEGNGFYRRIGTTLQINRRSGVTSSILFNAIVVGTIPLGGNADAFFSSGVASGSFSVWDPGITYGSPVMVAHNDQVYVAYEDVGVGFEPGTTDGDLYWNRIDAGVSSAELVIGNAPIRVYQHFQQRALLSTHDGAYRIRFTPHFDGHALQVGDKILVQGRANDPNATVSIQGSNVQNAASVSDSQPFVDGFATLTVSAAVTSEVGFSVVLQGLVEGQLQWDIQSVHIFRGANDLAIDVAKMDLLITPDLENFPPEFSPTYVYSVGDRFHHENAVYEVIQTIVGHEPPNDTYYRKLLDAAAVSNTDIDSRIADWAEAGNTDPIPLEKSRGISVLQSAGSANIGYDGQTGAFSTLTPASDSVAGLLTPGDKATIVAVPTWLTDGSRAPKNRLPSDVVYGLPTYRGEWNSSTAFAKGEMCTVGSRAFFAVAASSNIDPTQDSAQWIELGTSELPIDGRGVWRPTNAYSRGDIAVWGSGTEHQVLLCIAPVAANTETAPSPTYWHQLLILQFEQGLDGRIFLKTWDNGGDINKFDTGIAVMFFRGAWTTNTQYYQQNTVRRNDVTYVCTTDHTGVSSNAPGSSGGAGYWESI